MTYKMQVMNRLMSCR